MAVTEIGDHESGLIRLSSDLGTTTIQLRWPFDRSTDEWTVLSLRVPTPGSLADLQEDSLLGSRSEDHAVLWPRKEGLRVRFVGSNSAGPVQLEIDLSDAQASAFTGHFRT